MFVYYIIAVQLQVIFKYLQQQIELKMSIRKWNNLAFCGNGNYVLIMTILIITLISKCAGQYCNLTQTGEKTCYPCYYKCKQCTGVSEKDCLSCTKQYLLINNSCLSCGDNCFSCKAISNTTVIEQENIQKQCQTCINGYYLYQSTGKCIKCPTGAKTCTLSAIQSCYEGYYLENGLCFQCVDNCVQCSDSVTCLNCRQGYYLNSTGSCSKCPIQNCASCQSVSSCDRCQSGYSGNNCEVQCENRCGMCYGGMCFVCRKGFYMQNGSCEVGRVLCSMGNSYNECSECVDDLSSLGPDNLCLPFFTVHDENRLTYLTAINNNAIFLPLNTNTSIEINNTNSKLLLYCPLLSVHILTFSTNSIALETIVQPTYKMTLIAQLFVTRLSFSLKISVNGIAIDQSMINTVHGDLLYQCESNAFYIVNVNSSFSLTDDFNSSKQKLLVQITLQPLYETNNDGDVLIVATSQLYLEQHRCRVAHCLNCKSPYTCQTCQYPFKLENNQCLKSCSEGYYLTQTSTKLTCTLSCPQSYYPLRQDFTCQLCIHPCVQCQNQTTCHKCYHPNLNSLSVNTTTTNNQTQSLQSYFLYNSQCVTQCPQRFFADTETYQCQQCIFPCQNCVSFKKCTSCKIGYLDADNYACVPKCPSGQYSDFLQLKCLPCQQPCSLCEYSANACLQCVLPYFLYAKNSSCLKECPTGYAQITNSQKNQCRQCEFPCKSCFQSQTNCVSCIKGYLFDSKCLSQCPSGYYKLTTVQLNNICAPCQNNCLQCVDKQLCVSCKQGYKFNTIDKSCVTDCPKTTYEQSISINNGSDVGNKSQCLQCVPPCYDCTSATYCLSCTGLLFLNHLGECLLECPLGTFIFYNSTLQERQCMLCQQNCISCLSETSCKECKDGWLLYEGLCFEKCPQGTFANQKGQKYCEHCQYPCVQCMNEYKCLSCVNGFILQPDSTKCVQYCDKGYFETSSAVNPLTNKTVQSNETGLFELVMLCLKCNEQCETCIQSGDNCLSCAVGFYYNNASQKCSKECPSGTYYSETDRVCTQCAYPCKQCVSMSACVSCYNQQQFNAYSQQQSLKLSQPLRLTFQPIFYLHKCIEECPFGYYSTVSESKTLTCGKCEFPCEQCSMSSNNCTKCKLPSVSFYNFALPVDQNPLQCIQQCPSMYYQENYLCKPCQQPCSQCLSDSHCLKCIQNWYLLQSKCYENYCPFHYHKQMINGTGYCMLCDSMCRQCNGVSNNCTSCANNYYLIGNQTNSTHFTYSCTEQCPTFFYGSSAKMQCLKCESPCQQCYSKGYCKTCTIGYYMQVDKCVSSCSQMFYLTKSLTNTTQYCTKCQSPCQKCKDQSLCLSCVTGYFFLSENSSCVKECPSKMYGHKVQVYSSIQSDNFKGLCLPCSQLCEQCSSFSQCTSCNQSNERKYLQQGRCQSSCGEGYYLQIDYDQYYAYECKQCRRNCVSCTEYEVCEKCVSSFLYEGKCVDECPVRYYGSTGLRCEKCVSPCEQCYGEYNCRSCVEGFYLYNSICVRHCPEELWSDWELRECVKQCDSGKFRKVENRSCVNDCERFYSEEGQCVDRCWGLNDGQYLINSTGGCELCQNVNDNNSCIAIYTGLSYKLQAISVNGKLILLAKWNSMMRPNQKKITNNTASSLSPVINTTNDSLLQLMSLKLKQSTKIQQELEMDFIDTELVSKSQSPLVSAAVNEGNNRKLFQDENQQAIVISGRSPLLSLSQGYHKLLSVSTGSQQPSSIPTTSMTEFVSNSNFLWLEVSFQSNQQYKNSLPLSQFTGGYLEYSINQHLLLLSHQSYSLSPTQSQPQPLPIQSTQPELIEIKSYSSERKLPEQLISFSSYLSIVISCLMMILLIVNLIIDNVKSQFHLIDTIQNLFLLVWVSSQLQLGIYQYLQGFSLAAFIITLTPSYNNTNQIQQYKESLNSLSHDTIYHCPPKQFIYGNICNFSQYFLTLIPFIAIFLIVIIVIKALTYFKPFIKQKLKIRHQLIYNHVNNFYWLFATPVFFIATQQLMYQTSKSHQSNLPILNLILIIFVSLVTIVLGYQILKNIFNCSFQQKTFFWGLKCHKVQNDQANIHFLLVMIRKSIILIAAGLGVIQSDKQLVFVLLLIFVSIIILSNILANRPFKKRLYQYLIVASQVLLIVFYLILQIYMISAKNFDQSVFVTYNVVLMVMTVLVIVLQFIIAVSETVLSIKKKHHLYKIMEESERKKEQSKSSSCDQSSNNAQKQKEQQKSKINKQKTQKTIINKPSQKTIKHSQKVIQSSQENSQFVLVPASLNKFNNGQSNPVLKIKPRQKLGEQSNLSDNYEQQRETKHQKMNNSQQSHYQTSSGFEFHSNEHTEEFQQPAKYLIKMEKTFNDNEEKDVQNWKDQ